MMKSKMINLDETVTFVERPSSELYSLKVVQGPYLGVIYTYGKVSLKEDPELDQLKLTFDFKIDEVPESLEKKDLEKSAPFKTFIGDILSQLLDDKLNNHKLTDDNTQNTD